MNGSAVQYILKKYAFIEKGKMHTALPDQVNVRKYAIVLFEYNIFYLFTSLQHVQPSYQSFYHEEHQSGPQEPYQCLVQYLPCIEQSC